MVPVRDAVDVIEAQLEALASQTCLLPTEFILADNGSRDGTLALLDARAVRDERFRLVHVADGIGAAHARNAGTRAARGDLIAYCDADDVVAPAWLQSLVDASWDHDLVGGALDHEMLNGPEVRRWRAGLPTDDLPTTLRYLPYVVSANCAVRREVWASLGGWDPAMEHAEDVDFSWRVQLDGRTVGYVPRAVVHYRHRDSITQMWRQVVHYGMGDALLLAKYREHGARSHAPRTVLRRYVYVLTRLPYLVLGRERRGLWFVVAAGLWGRLKGSIRYRVVCL